MSTPDTINEENEHFQTQNAFLSEQTTPNYKISEIYITCISCFKHQCGIVSEIGAVVMVVDSHLCGWGSIPGESSNFSQSLMCVRE